MKLPKLIVGDSGVQVSSLKGGLNMIQYIGYNKPVILGYEFGLTPEYYTSPLWKVLNDTQETTDISTQRRGLSQRDNKETQESSTKTTEGEA